MAYNDRYGRDDRYNRDFRDDDRFRGRDNDRGFIDRAGDEVRSWFGDDEATRRRERDSDGYHFDGRDDRYDRQDNRSDAGFRGTFRRGSTSGSDDYGRTHYGASDYGRSNYGGYNSDRGRYGSSAPDYGRDRGAGYRSFGGGSGEGYNQADYSRASQGYGARSQQHHDDDYRSWRDRQVEAFDRDYDDYRRERQQRFHNEFDTWRQNRGGQTQYQAEQNGTQWRTKIREHQEVLGSDGEHVGVVDHVQDDQLKLTKRDGDGEHHFIPLTSIVSVDNAVRLNVAADEARRTWRGETGAGGTKPIK